MGGKSTPDRVPATRRTSMRYAGYDYTRAGAYFVTICTHRGQSLFGQISRQAVVLNSIGKVAESCWLTIPEHHPHVRLGEHVIMPNHVHGVVWILGQQSMDQSALTNRSMVDRPNTQAANEPIVRRFGQPVAGSLSIIVGTYKAAVSRQVNRLGLTPANMRWHRNYWDRVVRNEQELALIENYIRSNPDRWLADRLHPDAPLNEFNHEWRAPED